MTTLADFVRRARRVGLGYRNAARLRHARQSPAAHAEAASGRCGDGVSVEASLPDGHPT